MPSLDTGNTAWVLASSALVLLMTPGLAFFYGGMVRAKSVLNMLMMNFICIAVVTVAWVLYGWSVSFGNANDASGNGFWGGLKQWGMQDITTGIASNSHATIYGSTGVPIFAVACFQLMFAIITPALISGAIADRTKFVGWTVYVCAWVTVIYFPVAHWVFSPNGFINAKLHVMDFAGGTAVHINAGAGALACALVLGKRVGFKKDPMRPHNVPFVMLGAALLWFGWFGFNAGSALTSGGQASVVFMNTQVATCTAVIGWLAAEKIQHGKFTTVGAASGAVAGLVAITPACASVSPIGAIFVGLIPGFVCCYAVNLKNRFDFDDSLDVVGVHLVGGILGTLLIGFFAAPDEVSGFSNGAKAGLFYGGGASQLVSQAEGAGIVFAYSFIVSFILAKIVNATLGMRVTAEAEIAGIDQAEHAETAYDWGGLSGSLHRAAVSVAAATAAPSNGSAPTGTGESDEEKVNV
ncbi:ammonium transporter [Actinospica sp. MGRD01-02]|uniref:Ammonium transporter n=1 Tax=Actinospica acidithermotolerans TaxID=2828514 RepID=A0A941E6N0_9ACTN|nr:ammonium transporter [Actinospica acidithermotolerans]MBR7824913.1 ammonium transporter [Actinospica acidithermotolerans]